jgi:hypothetical protein
MACFGPTQHSYTHFYNFMYVPFFLSYAYVKCMPRWSATARCVYTYLSIASRIARFRFALSFSILSLNIFSRTGLAAYRWLLRISGTFLCFLRCHGLSISDLYDLYQKSHIIDLTLFLRKITLSFLASTVSCFRTYAPFIPA